MMIVTRRDVLGGMTASCLPGSGALGQRVRQGGGANAPAQLRPVTLRFDVVSRAKPDLPIQIAALKNHPALQEI